MRAWLASCAVAARLASDRADLWMPAALAWIVSVGWIPFALVVVPFPGEGDLVAFGAGLFTSSLWPLNAILIVLAGVVVVVAAILLRAVAEAALARAMALALPDRAAADTGGSGRVVAGLFLIRIVTAVPTALAIAAAGLVLAAVAPDEFQSPDIGGEVYVRVAGRLLPALVVLVLALLVGAVVAAVAGRHVVTARGGSAAVALSEAVRELARRPGPLLALASSTLLGAALYLLVCLMLLRVLWAPLQAVLAERPIAPADLLLLVGFVAIWLGLILGGGVVYGWASAWWALELRDVRGGRPEPVSAPEGMRPA